MRVPLLIVDDSSLLRQRIRALLARVPSVEVVGEAGTAAEALQMCRDLRPGLVLLDVSMPDRSGVEILPEILKLDPQPRVVILTNFPYASIRSQAVALGAAGFVRKTDPMSEITETIGRLAEEILDPAEAS